MSHLHTPARPARVLHPTALLTVLSLLALAACKGEEDPKPQPPGAEPSWEDARFAERWQREGYGEGFALAALDVDGDGEDEVLYGGRGLAALDARSREGHHPLWQLPWPKPVEATIGGDNDWVYALEVLPLNDDGIDDALVISSQQQAFGVDGATGALLWSTDLEADFLTVRVALFDGDDDGIADFFPSGGRAAYSGATGAKLWEIDAPLPITFPFAAELDGEPGDELLLVREIDSWVGTGGEGLPPGEDGVGVYAVASDGTVLWTHVPLASPIAAAVGDLDGDGLDDVYLGQEGSVEAVDAGGTVWQEEVDGLVVEVESTDLDGDGAADAVLGAFRFTGDTLVQAFAADGVELWQEIVVGGISAMTVLDLDGGLPEVLVATGQTQEEPIGAVVTALDAAPTAVDRVLWTAETHTPALSFAPAHVDGEDVVLVGGEATVLQALDLSTGAESWRWTAGGFVVEVEAADLDGDGVEDVVHGDDAGHLVASSALTGEQLWTRRLDVGGDGMVTGLAVGDVEGDGTADIVVSAMRYYATDSGLVERYDASGTLLWSLPLRAYLFDATLADLDGDGLQEVVLAEVSGTDKCSVLALSGETGSTLWRQSIGSCLAAFIAVGDADGDGTPEIAYGDTHIYLPVNVAMVAGDGSLLWKQAVDDADSYWVSVTEGGMLHGGFALDWKGHVSYRALADGAQAWRHTMDGIPDPELPEWQISGGSQYGAIGPDVDDDGHPEVLASNYAHDVRLLDGATGEALWVTRLEDESLGWFERHEGAVLAWVPPTSTLPGYVVAGEASLQRSRSRIVALDIDGEVVGEVERDGWGSDVAVTSYGAVVGGGLGVHAVEALSVE